MTTFDKEAIRRRLDEELRRQSCAASQLVFF